MSDDPLAEVRKALRIYGENGGFLGYPNVHPNVLTALCDELEESRAEAKHLEAVARRAQESTEYARLVERERDLLRVHTLYAQRHEENVVLREYHAASEAYEPIHAAAMEAKNAQREPTADDIRAMRACDEAWKRLTAARVAVAALGASAALVAGAAVPQGTGPAGAKGG